MRSECGMSIRPLSYRAQPIQPTPRRLPQRIKCPKCGMMVLVWDHNCSRASRAEKASE